MMNAAQDADGHKASGEEITRPMAINYYSLDFIEADGVGCTVVELRRPRRLVCRNLLCVLDSAAILQVCSDAGRSESVTSCVR